MKKSLTAVIAFLLFGTSLWSQEIEVTADEVELRAQNNNSTLTLQSNGTLALQANNDNSNWYNTMWTFVNRDLTKCYNVHHSGKPASQANTFYVRGDGTVVAKQVALNSDERYKENIKDLPSTLENVKKLKPKTYKMKNLEGKNNEKRMGVIAQELEKYYPEMVIEDEYGLKSVDYTQITIILLKAVQEQQEMIEKQQKEIEGLQKKAEKKDK